MEAETSIGLTSPENKIGLQEMVDESKSEKDVSSRRNELLGTIDTYVEIHKKYLKPENRVQPKSKKNKTIRSKSAREKRTNALRHSTETPEARSKRLERMRELRRLRLQSETVEHKLARLNESRERTRQKLLMETDEEREKRLKYLRDRQRQRIHTESKEEREKRLRYLSERQKKRIRTETAEARERRLDRSRKQNRKQKIQPEPELDVDILQDVMYIRDSQCQVILTEPSPEAVRDPLDLGDYQSNDADWENQHSILTIGRVWSLRPNEGVDDKLWFRDQL